MYTDGLETNRIITRFLTKDDVPAWLEYTSDPISTTFLPNETGLPVEEYTRQFWIGMTLKRYEEGRYGLQALLHKQTGELLGICGLLLQELGGKNEIEIGYHLFRKNWGQGFASEAAQAFRDYGFNYRIADSLISIIHPLNFQSKKVALRNGMQLTQKAATFRGKEVDVFRITREEWVEMKISNS